MCHVVFNQKTAKLRRMKKKRFKSENYSERTINKYELNNNISTLAAKATAVAQMQYKRISHLSFVIETSSTFHFVFIFLISCVNNNGGKKSTVVEKKWQEMVLTCQWFVWQQFFFSFTFSFSLHFTFFGWAKSIFRSATLCFSVTRLRKPSIFLRF